MADKRVTVVPVSNEAVRAVTTPYIAFKHELVDRPGRLTRQADAMDMRGRDILYALGDVWPAGDIWAYTQRRMYRFVSNFVGFRTIHRAHIWPETMLYRTDVIQSLQLNERASYRSVIEPWTRLRLTAGPSLARHTLFMPESMIEVPDRLTYVHKFAGPQLTLPPAACEVSVLAVLDGDIGDVDQVAAILRQTHTDYEVLIADCDGQGAKLDSLKDSRLRIIDTSGLTRAAAMNTLLGQAVGAKIALWDLSCTYVSDRLTKQAALEADISGSPVAGPVQLESYDPIPYCHTNFSGLYYIPQETMMFSRRVIETIGAFDPVLPVLYGMDLQLRAYTSAELSLLQLRKPLATRQSESKCSEEAVYSLYRLFVQRDLTLAHFARDGLHQWASFRRGRKCSGTGPVL